MSVLREGCGLLDTRKLSRGFWIRSCMCNPQQWYLTDQGWRDHIEPEVHILEGEAS